MKIRYEHWIFGGVGGPVNLIYISDHSNNRIIDRSIPNLVYVSEFLVVPGYAYLSDGFGNGSFYQPRGLCNDGTFLYVINGGDNLLKLTLGASASALTYVTDIGDGIDSGLPVVSGNEGPGSGNNQFNNARGICTDGTHLYIVDSGNLRIVKRLCSDLSYVAEISATTETAPYETLRNPRSIETDGTHVYVTNYQSGAGTWIFKFLCSNLAYDSMTTISTPFFDRAIGITIDGSSLFVSGYYIVI